MEADELRWIDDAECRFPAIARYSLEEAKGIALPPFDPDKRGAKQAERMRSVQLATTSVIASATAVETHVLMLVYFAMGAIKEHVGTEEAKGFARVFLKPGGHPPWTPGKAQHTLNSRQLMRVGQVLTAVLRADPEWPVQGEVDQLRKLRNRLLHNTVVPSTTKPPDWERDYEPGISLEMLADQKAESLLEQAEESFRTMVRCCRSAISATAAFGDTAWPKEHRDQARTENARRILANLHLLIP